MRRKTTAYAMSILLGLTCAFSSTGMTIPSLNTVHEVRAASPTNPYESIDWNNIPKLELGKTETFQIKKDQTCYYEFTSDESRSYYVHYKNNAWNPTHFSSAADGTTRITSLPKSYYTNYNPKIKIAQSYSSMGSTYSWPARQLSFEKGVPYVLAVTSTIDDTISIHMGTNPTFFDAEPATGTAPWDKLKLSSVQLEDLITKTNNEIKLDTRSYVKVPAKSIVYYAFTPASEDYYTLSYISTSLALSKNIKVKNYGGMRKYNNRTTFSGYYSSAYKYDTKAENAAQSIEMSLNDGDKYLFAFFNDNNTEATIEYILTRGYTKDASIYGRTYSSGTQGTSATQSTNNTTSTSSGGGGGDDDDDDDDKGSSFSDGGTKTGGSGTSKADYKKSGKGAKYVMAEASTKAASIKVPATVKIGKKTFNVNSIAADAFVGFGKLKTVIIGKNVSKIDAEAFSGCKGLVSVTLNTTKLTAKNIKGCFKGAKVKVVYVPVKKVDAYKKIFTKAITGNASAIKVKAKPKISGTK